VEWGEAKVPMSDPEEDALFQAVLAAPDDTPRLIYADWLEERGDPRAELIRVQCGQIDLPFFLEGDPRNTELAARLKLVRTSLRRWDGALRRRLARGPLHNQALRRRGQLSGWAYRRGFIEAIAMQLDAFLDHAETVFSQVGPVRYIRFPMREFPGQPMMHEIPGQPIRSRGETNTLIQRLAGSPYLARLTTLDLHNNDLHDDEAELLAASPHLAGLKVLDLSQNWITRAGAQALRASPFLKGLTTLYLANNYPAPHSNGMVRRRGGGLFAWLDPAQAPSRPTRSERR
jgi:uncharacterized protein (TIGR02996 family)